MLQAAVEIERDAFLVEFAERRTVDGRTAVVGSGYHPEPAVQTGIRPITVKVPKVRFKDGKPVTFRSALVPPYVRKARPIEAALPWLYLKGISIGEMGAAVSMLLGPDATGFSAKTVSRLKGQWAAEYADWRKADLSRDEWVYVWGPSRACFAYPAGQWTAFTAGCAAPMTCPTLAEQPNVKPPFRACKHALPGNDRKRLCIHPTPHEAGQWLFVQGRHAAHPSCDILTECTVRQRMFKRRQCAKKSWRKLRGFTHLADVIQGVDFVNGIKPSTQKQTAA